MADHQLRVLEILSEVDDLRAELAELYIARPRNYDAIGAISSRIKAALALGQVHAHMAECQAIEDAAASLIAAFRPPVPTITLMNGETL